MNAKVWMGLIRHLLTAVGGATVASGWMDEGVVQDIVGAVMTLAGAIWSILAKRQEKAPPPAAAISGPAALAVCAGAGLLVGCAAFWPVAPEARIAQANATIQQAIAQCEAFLTWEAEHAAELLLFPVVGSLAREIRVNLPFWRTEIDEKRSEYQRTRGEPEWTAFQEAVWTIVFNAQGAKFYVDLYGQFLTLNPHRKAASPPKAPTD
jgi:hypothetical protein